MISIVSLMVGVMGIVIGIIDLIVGVRNTVLGITVSMICIRACITVCIMGVKPAVIADRNGGVVATVGNIVDNNSRDNN